MNSAAIKWLLLVHQNPSRACSPLQNEARVDTGEAGGRRSSKGKAAGTAKEAPEEECDEENSNGDTFGKAAAPPTESWDKAAREDLAICVAAAVSEQLRRDFLPAVRAALAGNRQKRGLWRSPFPRLSDSARSNTASSSAKGSSSSSSSTCRRAAQQHADPTTHECADHGDAGGCRPPLEPRPGPAEHGHGGAQEEACQGAVSNDHEPNNSGTTPAPLRLSGRPPPH